MSIALVHDYLTQRGGAERVVLVADAGLSRTRRSTRRSTTPDGTFPEFADGRRAAAAAERDRARSAAAIEPALPLLSARVLAPSPLVPTSSSAARAAGRTGAHVKGPQARLLPHARALAVPTGPLPCAGAPRRLPARGARPAPTAASARGPARRRERRHVISRTRPSSQGGSATTYGIEAEVIPPPPAITPYGETEAVPGIEPGFVLAVSRLLPYKNLSRSRARVPASPQERLVLVGNGPLSRSCAASPVPNVALVGGVSDRPAPLALRQLRRSGGCVARGLRPDAARSRFLRQARRRPPLGGFLDTVVGGRTGFFSRVPRGARSRPQSSPC